MINFDEILLVDIRSSLTKSGLLLFLAGLMIFMGIITSEIFYKKAYNTHDNYISELGVPVQQDSAESDLSMPILNYTLIISGLMIIIATFFIQRVFKKLILTIPAVVYGIGLLGVGYFPGNKPPFHEIFALALFIAGGLATITSSRILSAPLKYVFICMGIISLVFLIAFKYFVPYFGVGGTERWALYPTLFWLTGLGGYLLGIKDEYKNISHVKPV